MPSASPQSGIREVSCQVEKEVPPELDLHLIMDNSSTQRSPLVQHWLRPKKRQRFHAGVDGLGDRHRSGRPRCYGAEPTTEILKAAMARPGDLNLGFTTWSLPKLEEYLREQKELPVARSTIRRRLREAGLRFRVGQTWCRSTDSDFEVKKRHCGAVPEPAAGGSAGVHGRNGAPPDHPSGWQQLGVAGRASSRPLST